MTRTPRGRAGTHCARNALLALLLLAIPATVSLGVAAKIIGGAYQQLRAGKVPEDDQLEQRLAQLKPLLRGVRRVGFWDRRTGPAEDPPRLQYFLQYSLAPIVVTGRSDAEFVVIVDEGESISADPTLSVVVDAGGGIRLFHWNR